MKKALILGLILLGVALLAWYLKPTSVKQQTSNDQESTTSIARQTQLNKKVSELLQLSDPIVCDISQIEKVREGRKNGESQATSVKLFIKNGIIRDEGVSIFTDGTEKPSLNIINPSKKNYYSLLLDGSNGMASLDYEALGGDAIITNYDSIPAQDINCKVSAFDEKLLTPNNVCYVPPSTNQPQCKIAN